MAKRLEPDTVLILKNQHAIMTVLRAIILNSMGNGNVLPLLKFQLEETDKAIQNNAVADQIQ